MGCGVSGLNSANNSTAPQNRRPLLQQRLFAIKKRLQTGGQINPYKKELLNKDGDEEGPSSDQQILSRKNSSIASVEERISCVTDEGTRGSPGHARKDSFLSTNNEGFENNEEDDENEHTAFDERMIRRNDFHAPGSPSFRVYCSENDKNRKTFDEKIHSEIGLIKEETPSEEDEETQKVEPKMVKQTRRRRSFRNVIPSIPSGGKIKNLLNVNPCTPRGQGRPPSP